MYKRLAHVCIHATDLDETLAFYTDGLGLEKGFTFEREGKPFGFYLKLGDSSFIEIFKGEPNGEGTIKHFAVQVECIDDVIKRLTDHGIGVTDKMRGKDHSWQAWVTDPNGVRIEFHEYTSESMQLVGGICRF